jgi:ribose 5-phosphate isomerase B
MKPTIYLAADHAGFELKEYLKSALLAEGYEVTDMGNSHKVPEDDYPDFIGPLAKRVAAHAESRGIGICGSGQGTCMVANKTAGVRAGLGYDTESVRVMREDNDANMLCLPGRSLEENDALALVHLFLDTSFSNAPRHQRRVDKLNAMV